MAKMHKKIISLVCSGMMLAGCTGITACGGEGENEKMIEVIGASAMYKYEQRHTFSDAEKATEIKMDAAANEYESAQIIICANDEKVSFYDVLAADFVSANGTTISKKNVEIYSAYYNSISNSENGYPGGYIPDVLIPMESRVEYGDNVVATGENQAVWFTVYVPKGTPAGEYKSNFSVTVNEKNYTVPVTLNVYGFELPDETHVKSAFAIWGPTYGNDMLTNVYGNKARAAENAYYEFLLKYRIAPTSLPNLDLSSVESWVDQAVEYAARADVPSFSLPFRRATSDKHANWFDEAYMHDVLAMLVDRSTEEQNIFAKLYAYGIVDEPDYTKEYEKTRDFTTAMKNIVQAVLNEKDAVDAFKDKPSVRESLKNLQTLITLCNWGEDIGGDIGNNITGYCPKYFLFDTEENRNEFAQLQENNIGIWAYGCNIPGWPYPTYQIDADLVSPRSVGVMQMRYNIEGNLFWCTNVSRVFDGMSYTDNWDPFKTHYAFSKWPGDGFLVAPAGRYEKRSIAPYPTMRLEMIREGQEDYEYLYMLKALVATKGDDALTALTNALELEYDKVLTGAQPTEDPEKMIAFKKTIANMILENL